MAFVSANTTTYPLYLPRLATTTIPGTSVTSAQPFNGLGGYVVISATDSATGYVWSFAASGKYGSTSVLPTANSTMFSYPDTAVGCTVKPVGYTPGAFSNCLVTTPVGDAGGRTYEIIFYSASGVKPTIRKTAGAAVAANLVVQCGGQVFSITA